METFEEILERMKSAYQEESGHSAEDVSDTGLRLRVLAGELYRLRTKLTWLERQAFPQTASGEWLSRHGEQRGVKRREAAKAKGTVTFSRWLPLSFDAVIPAGTVCAVPGEEPIEFETLENGVLEAGKLSVDVPAQAVRGGGVGNVAAGYINTLTDPPVGINYVTNKAAFTGGKEAESDEEYRVRVLAAYGQLSNGTNAAYYRDCALSCEGVGAVGVVPRKNGAGTVGLYLWGENGAPDEAVVSRVKSRLEAEREIGVTVDVQSATANTVNVACRLKLKSGAELEKAKADIAQALSLYFAGLTVGSPVYLTELQQVILGAAPVTALEFAASMRNVAAAQNTVPVLGTVSVEAMT